MTSTKHLTVLFLGLALFCINPPTATDAVLVAPDSQILTARIFEVPPVLPAVIPATKRTVAPTMGEATTTTVITSANRTIQTVAANTTESPSISPNSTRPSSLPPSTAKRTAAPTTKETRTTTVASTNGTKETRTTTVASTNGTKETRTTTVASTNGTKETRTTTVASTNGTIQTVAANTTASPNISLNSTRPSSFSLSECINGYYRYPFTRRMGGNRINGGNTEAKCKNLCDNNTKCWGYSYESEQSSCYIYVTNTFGTSRYLYYYKDIAGGYTKQENVGHHGGVQYFDFMTQSDCQFLCDSFSSCTGYTSQKNGGSRQLCRLHIYAFFPTREATHNHYQVCGSGKMGKTYK